MAVKRSLSETTWLSKPAHVALEYQPWGKPFHPLSRSLILHYCNFINKKPRQLIEIILKDRKQSPKNHTSTIFSKTIEQVLSIEEYRIHALSFDPVHASLLTVPFPKNVLPTNNPPSPLRTLMAHQWQNHLVLCQEFYAALYFPGSYPLYGKFSFNEYSANFRMWLMGKDWSELYEKAGGPFHWLSTYGSRHAHLHRYVSMDPNMYVCTGDHSFPDEPPFILLKYYPLTDMLERVKFLLSYDTPYHYYFIIKLASEIQKKKYSKEELLTRTNAQSALKEKVPYMPLLDLPIKKPKTEQDHFELDLLVKAFKNSDQISKTINELKEQLQ